RNSEKIFSSNFTKAHLIGISETGDTLAAVISSSQPNSQQLRLWSNPWSENEYLTSETSDVESIALADRFPLVVTGHRDGVVRCWNPATMNQIVEVGLHRARVTAIAIGNDGQVATADDNGIAYLWNGKTGKRLGGPFAHP